ncbi:tetratricopeptide repeat protein [Sphingorhabdus sp.]|jgi:tetratricopeptide (TPR) repeat protein|uniref:tetratricopeptide repeat protein n=1 Tax=Sphingorhabdus sp. TaxID=1902408 RepID=UPI0037C5A870
MLLFPLFLLQAAPVAAQPLPTLDEVQFAECLTLAGKDPVSAISSASLWAQEKGGYLARACHGFALATDFKIYFAVPILAEAATLAAAKGDPRAARFWAQAGNAAIASGQPDFAVDALSNALVSNTLDINERADSEVDRARAFVALGKNADGEAALATARQLAPENGAAWLLSATLARRLNKLPDALAFIQTAAAVLPSDPAVALEAGNIAIAAGDDNMARTQWEQAIKIAPNSRQATTARAQLAALAAETPAAQDAAQSR